MHISFHRFDVSSSFSFFFAVHQTHLHLQALGTLRKATRHVRKRSRPNVVFLLWHGKHIHLVGPRISKGRKSPQACHGIITRASGPTKRYQSKRKARKQETNYNENADFMFARIRLHLMSLKAGGYLVLYHIIGMFLLLLVVPSSRGIITRTSTKNPNIDLRHSSFGGEK